MKDIINIQWIDKIKVKWKTMSQHTIMRQRNSKEVIDFISFGHLLSGMGPTLKSGLFTQ